MEVFPTGLRGIDADLHHGGIPAGSVVGVEYPPESAGEAFLWTVVARGFHPDASLPVARDETTFVRPDRVTYVATGKRPAAIAAALAEHGPAGSVDEVGLPVEFDRLDLVRGETPRPASARDPGVDRPAIVVDSASDLLEFAPADEATTFLSAVRAAVRKRRGIALLSFARSTRRWSPLERHVLQVCDGHVRFEPGEGEASAAVRFARLRGAAGPVEGFPAVFDLDIRRRVTVDTVEQS